MSDIGYTHYWRTNRQTPSGLLAVAGLEMIRVIEATDVPLGGAIPGTMPEFDIVTGAFGINGVGEDAHESFTWPPDLNDPQEWRTDIYDEDGSLYVKSDREEWVFEFCKTARKPYDVVVVACLLVAERVLGDDYIKVSTDASDVFEYAGAEVSDGWKAVNAMLGHPTSHLPGETATALYERVFGELPRVPRCFAPAAPLRIVLDFGEHYDAVYVNGERLEPKRSHKVFNHSPDGFAWGYGGSGPSQLALAILLEAGLDNDEAVRLHQDFKNEFVATWPQTDGDYLIDVVNWANTKGVEV